MHFSIDRVVFGRTFYPVFRGRIRNVSQKYTPGAFFGSRAMQRGGIITRPPPPRRSGLTFLFLFII
jgi:hypothetical protein